MIRKLFTVFLMLFCVGFVYVVSAGDFQVEASHLASVEELEIAAELYAPFSALTPA